MGHNPAPMAWHKRAAVFLAVASISAIVAFAQTSGQIRGRVADGDGGYLAGASVKASSAQTGTHAVKTDSEGRYAIPNLPPGAYVVAFRMEGYAPVDKKANVRLDGRANVDAKLFRVSP